MPVSGPIRATSASPDMRAVMLLSLPPLVTISTSRPSFSKYPSDAAQYSGA